MRSSLQNYARTLKFSLYIIVNPFKGFWDMKREKKGSLSAALTILALAVISTVAEAQYLSFPFNTAYYEPKNFFSASLSLLLPFALWCVVSYCLTTLMNGEGAFRDIVMATCYALTPMVLTYIPLTLISYALTLEESGLVTLVHTVVLIWTAFLLIAGTLEIHQYTMFKTVMTILFTIIGIAIVIFLGLLLFTLMDQMWTFVSNLAEEISLRLR